jgi:hypothetical protein
MFMQYLKTQETIDFIKSMILCFGAPVIGGFKCAVLLNLSRHGEDIRPKWRQASKEISTSYQLELSEISATERSVLILAYRPELLLQAIKPKETRCFLSEFGYDGFDCAASCIARLKERFKGGIPHEVGLFLGYPLEDVKGFIDNNGMNSKCIGYWKVYGDKDSAMDKFNEFKRAETETARSLLKKAGVLAFSETDT